MLIAYLISIFFAAETYGAFLLPDIKQHVKTAVENDTKEKQLLAIFDTAFAEAKAFEKKDDLIIEDWRAIEKDKNISRKAMEQLFQKSINERTLLQNKLIEHNLKIRSLLTEEEFQNIVTLILNPNEKTQYNRNKKSALALQDIRDVLDELHKTLQEEIKDTVKGKQALQALSSFELVLNKMIAKVKDFNLEDISILQKKEISRQELKALYANLDKLRAKYNTNYIDLRLSISKLTTNQEWDAIFKTFSKLF